MFGDEGPPPPPGRCFPRIGPDTYIYQLSIDRRGKPGFLNISSPIYFFLLGDKDQQSQMAGMPSFALPIAKLSLASLWMYSIVKVALYYVFQQQ